MKYNYRTFLRVLITGILLSVFIGSFGQVSRQQAIDSILNSIIVQDTGKVNVYAAKDSLAVSDSILLADGRKIVCSYAENWVFFIDCKSSAKCLPVMC